MKTIFAFFVLLFTPFCFYVICPAQGIQGYVVDAKGKPIKDVEVNGEFTDGGGFFKAKSDTRFIEPGVRRGVIYFKKSGYVPQAKIIDFETREIRVALEEVSPQSIVKIPTCNNLQKARTVGNVLVITIPETSQAKTGFDVDYGYYGISFGKGNSRKWMRGMYGQFATNGIPFPDWLVNSENFTARAWRSENGVWGTDWKGRLTTGEFWRHLSFFYRGGEQVEYKVSSKEAADYFDRIIDNSCIQIPNSAGNKKLKSK